MSVWSPVASILDARGIKSYTKWPPNGIKELPSPSKVDPRGTKDDPCGSNLLQCHPMCAHCGSRNPQDPPKASQNASKVEPETTKIVLQPPVFSHKCNPVVFVFRSYAASLLVSRPESSSRGRRQEAYPLDIYIYMYIVTIYIYTYIHTHICFSP